jgi:hypothetical protein
LLLGNHDLMYYFLGERLYQCSGFRSSYCTELNILFKENKSLFQAAFQINNYLFTHAGLSKSFLNTLQKRLSDKIQLKNKEYADFLNLIFDSIPNYLADVSFYRGGMNNWGSIFWADLQEHLDKNNHIKGLSQIVGHQPVKKITKMKFDKDEMIWTDTGSHPESKEFPMYELEIL